MIKKLSLKFVLVFLVLVVSVFITSTCYAAYTATYGEEVLNSPLSYNDIMSDSVISGYINSIAEKKDFDASDIGICAVYNRGTNVYYYYLFFRHSEYSNLFVTSNSSFTGFGFVKNNVHSTGYVFDFTYSETDGIVYGSYLNNYIDGNASISLTYFTYTWKANNTLLDFLDITNIPIYQDLGQTVLLYEPVFASVDVTHEFQSDTSAKVNFDYSSYGTDYILKYSLTGVEISTDLTAPLQLKNPVTYSPRSN